MELSTRFALLKLSIKFFTHNLMSLSIRPSNKVHLPFTRPLWVIFSVILSVIKQLLSTLLCLFMSVEALIPNLKGYLHFSKQNFHFTVPSRRFIFLSILFFTRKVGF